jgi:hypothetical protein
MPYENIIAPVLILLVLLVPLLKWAKDKWMAAPYVIEVRTSKGEKKIKGDSLSVLVADLLQQVGGTSEDALKILRFDPKVRGQLEKQEAWFVLVDFLDSSVDFFAKASAEIGDFDAVAALFMSCTPSVQREIIEIISGYSLEDEAVELKLVAFVDSLISRGCLTLYLAQTLLNRAKATRFRSVWVGTITNLANVVNVARSGQQHSP